MSTRTAFGALAGAPLAILVAGYVWLARDYGTPWLLPVVVHEGGRYTFAETILYCRHFLRELPVVALYAAASVTAAAAYGPRCATAPSRALRAAALGTSGLLIAGAWLATVHAWGADVAWQELAQSYLRDDEAPRPGVHWGYHLLSTSVYIAAAVVLAAALQRIVDGHVRTPRAGATRAFRASVALLLGLAALLRPGTEPFVDARYLGHQAREAATHVLVTLPLSFATLLVVCGWNRVPPAGRRGRSTAPAARRAIAMAAGVGGLVLAYLVLGSMWTRAADAARPGVPLSSLIGAHWWEHSLDYLLAVLLVIAFAPAADDPAAV